MLIRGQTTEERIGEIASKFAQGINGATAGMKLATDANNQSKQQDLIREREARQRAIQELDVEAKLTEQTGRNVIGSGLGAKIMKGEVSSLDFGAFPLSAKSQREATTAERQARKDESIINKNNRATTNPQPSYEQKLEMKTQAMTEAKNKERQNPEYKLEKLGAEGRSKVGAIASGFQALDQMTKASTEGHGPQHVDSNTPFVGRLISDNPYSEGERLLTEVVGRLQSGGAIGAEELKTFRALG